MEKVINSIRTVTKNLSEIFKAFKKVKRVKYDTYFMNFLKECNFNGHDVTISIIKGEIEFKSGNKPSLSLVYNIVEGHIKLLYGTPKTMKMKEITESKPMTNTIGEFDNSIDSIDNRIYQFLRIVGALNDSDDFLGSSLHQENNATHIKLESRLKGKLYIIKGSIKHERPYDLQVEIQKGMPMDITKYPKLIHDSLLALHTLLDAVNEDMKGKFDSVAFEKWADENDKWEIDENKIDNTKN